MAGKKETENPRKHPRRLWRNGVDNSGKEAGEQGQTAGGGRDSGVSSAGDEAAHKPGNPEHNDRESGGWTPPGYRETPSWWQPKKQSSDAEDPQGQHSHLKIRSERQCVELCPICRTADLISASAPPEFHEQLETFQHEALGMLRSLIDAYIDRMDRREEPSAGVEDIPIE